MAKKVVRFLIPDDSPVQDTLEEDSLEIPGSSDDGDAGLNQPPNEGSLQEEGIVAPTSSDGEDLGVNHPPSSEHEDLGGDRPPSQEPKGRFEIRIVSDEEAVRLHHPQNQETQEESSIEIPDSSDGEDAGLNQPSSQVHLEEERIVIPSSSDVEDLGGNPPPSKEPKEESVDVRSVNYEEVKRRHHPQNQETPEQGDIEIPDNRDEGMNQPSNQGSLREERIVIPSSSDAEDLGGDNPRSQEPREECVETRGVNDKKDERLKKPQNQETPEEDRIEVLSDSDEESSRENLRLGLLQESDYQVEENKPQEASVRANRKDKMRDEEDNRSRPDQLYANASCKRLLCIWLRKCYGWITVGLLCITTAIVTYVTDPLFKLLSDGYVTPTAILLSGFLFLVGPFIRLWELCRAGGPRIFTFRALRNMMNLA